MMKVRTSLWASLAIAASVGLAGCGGSSNENQQLSAADQCTADGGTFADEKCTLPIDTQRAALKTALETVAALTTNLSGTPTQAVIDDAKTKVAALKTAIDNAEDVPKEELDAHRITHTAADNLVKAAQVARTDVDDEAQKKATADLKKAGDALYKALRGTGAEGATALDNITFGAEDSGTRADGLGSDGLQIDIVVNAGSGDADGSPAARNNTLLKPKSGTVEPLSGWKGADFARTEGTGSSAFTSDEARVYHNQGAAETMPFSGTNGKYGVTTTGGFVGEKDTTVTAFNFSEGGTFTTQGSKIKIPSFTEEGTQTRTKGENEANFRVAGTFDGAPGHNQCTGNCASTISDGKLTALVGTAWNFKPASGAMVSSPDADYLYFGWWVSKDKDGAPTAASAFVGTVEGTPIAANNTTTIAYGWETNANAISGTATYTGAAAGKYAYRDISEGTAHGGHFTADAELEAKFGATTTAGNGVTGTIDNFRLNDGTEDPGWKVSLNRAGWTGSGAVIATDAEADTDGYAPANTTWSINDNPAAVSGEWSGTMYDEKPGAVSDDGPGDGNNIPTTVTGTFYSEFGSEGRMVGAFGATR